MTRKDYLILQIISEAAEVIQEATKMQQFGPDDVYPGKADQGTNRDRLVYELNDLIASVNKAAQEGVIPFNWLSGSLLDAKSAKIEKYMLVSEHNGILSSTPDPANSSVLSAQLKHLQERYSVVSAREIATAKENESLKRIIARESALSGNHD